LCITNGHGGGGEAFERLAFSRFVGAILDNFGELSDEDWHLFPLCSLASGISGICCKEMSVNE